MIFKNKLCHHKKGKVFWDKGFNFDEYNCLKQRQDLTLFENSWKTTVVAKMIFHMIKISIKTF